MRVLVLEAEPGAAAGAIDQLTEAGHEVSRCHDPGAGPFPCNGMIEGHDCPLDADQVSVAVVIGRDADPGSASADGARCALRRHIPLVVAGTEDDSPYADWAAAVTPGAADVVPAVEQAASAPLRRHADAARRSLRSVMEVHELDGAKADAEVVRVGSDLRVTLRPGVPLTRGVADMASVRALGAVRDIDPYPRYIDVTVDGA